MGREFIDLFDEWADSYDQTVTGHDVEYKEVFEGYEMILEEVVSHTKGNTVLEFGLGTGNLTKRLLDINYVVYGVEPSLEMIKIAKEKCPEATITEGDFLNFPLPEAKIETITSTYAFHHLTDPEKEAAIKNFNRLLSRDGSIVFADTVFIDQEAKKRMIQDALQKRFYNLAEDLNEEYYTDIPSLRSMFERNGFAVHFKQLNNFVWLIKAQKL